MKQEFIETLFDLAKWIIVCPGLGWVFTICLVNGIQAMGYEIKNLKVAKLWAYTTLFVFGLCVLLEVYV